MHIFERKGPQVILNKTSIQYSPQHESSPPTGEHYQHPYQQKSVSQNIRFSKFARGTFNG